MLEFLNVKTEPLQHKNQKSEQGLQVKSLGTSEMVVILNQKGNQTLHKNQIKTEPAAKRAERRPKAVSAVTVVALKS
jgi:hypothetical protein